jgi:thioredoxin 1
MGGARPSESVNPGLVEAEGSIGFFHASVQMTSGLTDDTMDRRIMNLRRWTMPEADEGEPTRQEIDQSNGPVLLEFGASWCPHCQALAPKLDRLLASHPGIRHIKVEDGPGRLLGRSFCVKIWPNLVFLRDGHVIKQLARPDEEEVTQGLKALFDPE